MVDANGRLIYVGKAKRLRVRLLSYFRRKGRDRKAGRILAQTRTILWEPCGHEFLALLRELELIRCWRPAYNVQGQPRSGRFAFVCIGRAPAPYVYLARQISPKALATFGPLRPRRTVREAVRLLNDLFQLRDCPRKQTMVFTEDAKLLAAPLVPACLRHELGTCLGPCAGLCSRRAYNHPVRAARSFLGGDDSLLQQLTAEMTAAAQSLSFERAAIVRDRLETLQSLRLSLDRVREAQARHTFVYRLECAKGKETRLVLCSGRVVAAFHEPSSTRDERQAQQQFQEILTKHPEGLPVAGEDLDEVLLVAAWFRRHPEELARTQPLPHGFQANSPLSTLQSLPKKPATRMPSGPLSSISGPRTRRSGKPVPETK
jgi:excinuclease ABC subunit C